MKLARSPHGSVLDQQGLVVAAAAVDRVVDGARRSRLVRFDSFAPTTFPWLLSNVVVCKCLGQAWVYGSTCSSTNIK
jgi:hypothetical protein